MKMSKENYEKLTNFYNYTVEHAGDLEVTYILECLAEACAVAAKKVAKEKAKHNGKN